LNAFNFSGSKLNNREIKRSKLVWVDGEGHEIFIDQADKCIKEIKDFIGSLGYSPDSDK